MPSPGTFTEIGVLASVVVVTLPGLRRQALCCRLFPEWPAVWDNDRLEDSETPVGGEVFFQVGLRVAEGNLVLLQQPVDFEPCLQL